MRRAELKEKLIDACHIGDRRKAALCLRRGASPNQPDRRMYYPLHMACQEGHFNVVNLLVKNGANLNLKDNAGRGETALFRAVGAGHLRIVRYLIKAGCNVNLRRGGPAGDTPLHIACAWGRLKEAVELVNVGAKIKALDDEKHPPIYHAVANGHFKITAFLIKCGALLAIKATSKKLLWDIATTIKDKKMLHVIDEILKTKSPHRRFRR